MVLVLLQDPLPGGRQPGGRVARDVLLEEPLSLDPVGVSDDGDGPSREVREHGRGDQRVVPDDFAFGESGRRVQRFVQIGRCELPVFDPDCDLVARRLRRYGRTRFRCRHPCRLFRPCGCRVRRGRDGDLAWLLVLAQSAPGGVAQTSRAAGELPVHGLADHRRLDPPGPADVRARRLGGERVPCAFEGFQPRPQVFAFAVGQSRAHVPDVEQIAGAGLVRAEQQPASRPGDTALPGVPPAHDHLSGLYQRVLQPGVGAFARCVGRTAVLRDESFVAGGGYVREQVGGRAAIGVEFGEGDRAHHRHSVRVGHRRRQQLLSAFVVGGAQQRFRAKAQQVEREEPDRKVVERLAASGAAAAVPSAATLLQQPEIRLPGLVVDHNLAV
ncbi:hypothetical protein SAMN05421854_11947 [Amycolatopsis rubida]|uniref:Uncharacterized protein n=1 Tax=Amycolatopsis rubida TaxID=112413 RepID=A0A1I6AII5_9PSEU|nr:hypothetical protein SAMN05421854_11947 [Amycolatopsis rubida]